MKSTLTQKPSSVNAVLAGTAHAMAEAEKRKEGFSCEAEAWATSECLRGAGRLPLPLVVLLSGAVSVASTPSIYLRRVGTDGRVPTEGRMESVNPSGKGKLW
jgi:hypothetical protein